MVYSSERRRRTALFEEQIIKIVTDHDEIYARRVAEFMYPLTDVHCCTMEYAHVENALRRLVKYGRLKSELRKDVSLERGGHVRRRWYRSVTKESAPA